VTGAVLGGDARESFAAPFNDSGAVLYLSPVRPVTPFSILPAQPRR
jgi:hypothetical protein